MKNLENVAKMAELSQKISKIPQIKISKFIEIPSSLKNVIENQKNFSQFFTTEFQKSIIPLIDIQNYKIPQLNLIFNSDFYKSIQKILETFENLKNNPELQFAAIAELEILSLKSSENLSASFSNDIIENDIIEKEKLIEKNLLPYLERMNLASIWIGANYALSSDDNPDKLRHCLISLRTLLEYIIDEKLAPKSLLANDEKFKKEFKNYNSGKESIEFVWIKRSKKIEYFSSKIQFGMLEELTKKDIDLICNFYSTLCNIHQPNIGISENQVRILKLKTGITLWLLAYIYEVINE